MAKNELVIPVKRIEKSILVILGQRVLLDSDLADLYGVSTKALKQAVRRNIDRFPSDFMFELTHQEFSNLRSQFVTSSLPQWGGARYKPMAFTEQGIAMLSSVLRSRRAIQVNIAIMRAFVQMRELTVGNRELARKIDDLEKKHARHDQQFVAVFDAIRQMMVAGENNNLKIGFGPRDEG